VLTNVHDKMDTLETFQPVTVGIHVQEMKGFRKELILSILSPHPFEDEQVEEELNLIVDFGGCVEDVFIFHKIYGTVRGQMNIRSRNDVKMFMDDLKSGKSSLLKNVTSGYHYHTVTGPSIRILDLIQEQLAQKGFLAKLQDYEPINFWEKEEEEK